MKKEYPTQIPIKSSSPTTIQSRSYPFPNPHYLSTSLKNSITPIQVSFVAKLPCHRNYIITQHHKIIREYLLNPCHLCPPYICIQ